jgi:hypothetical protein
MQMDRHMGRQTDMTKLIFAFCNFVNTQKDVPVSGC